MLNTYEGMRSAPADLIEVGRALKFTTRQRILRIHLPSAMPSIATGVHLGLIYSWLATVGAEYFLAVGPGWSSPAASVSTWPLSWFSAWSAFRSTVSPMRLKPTSCAGGRDRRAIGATLDMEIASFRVNYPKALSRPMRFE